MFGIIKSLLHDFGINKFDDPIIGEKWVYTGKKSPWCKVNEAVEIIDVKQGWVKYQIRVENTVDCNDMELAVFFTSFKPYKEKLCL